MSYALYSIFSMFALKKDYHSLTITFYTFVMAAVATFFLVHPLDLLQRIVQQDVFWNMFLFSVVTALIPYICYTKGLSNMPASQASVLATIEPVVAAMIGILLFKEDASWQKLLGIILVLGGVVVRVIGQKEAKQQM